MNTINQSAAQISPGAGGQPRVRLAARDGASAEIYLQGAHLTSWRPAKDATERLFLSQTSEFRAGTAIRGGIPVIFPQFAALGPLPKHGFARTSLWTLVRSGFGQQGSAEALLRLKDDPATRSVWPHVFTCELEISVAGDSLVVGLTVKNTGPAAFGFTAALHTYLRVVSIGEARVTGLAGLRYRDSTQGGAEFTESSDRLAITGEIDRIYLDAPATLKLTQPKQTMSLHTKGFADAVVWNPGAAGGLKLADLEAGGNARMLCVEAAQIGRPVRLEPEQSWSGSQTLVAG